MLIKLGESMENLVLLIVIFVVAVIIAIKSAEIFIDNLVDVGSALGISEIVLGVTASAIGSSLLEFGSAMTAIFTGTPEVGLGVVLGANIWNIAGILGIAAIFAGTMKINSREITRDGIMALLTAVIFMISIYFTGKVDIIISAVMITAYGIYLWILIKDQKNDSLEDKDKERTPINSKNVIWVVLGIMGLILGCRLLVYSSLELASLFNVSGMIIGLVILALVTTVPELIVTVTSAVKGLHQLAFGTILGSNVFNILIGVGVPAVFTNIHVEEMAITFDGPALIFITILLLILMKRGMKLTRYEGIALLSTYVIYIGTRLRFMV
jgi:cation:H+ antiporter